MMKRAALYLSMLALATTFSLPAFADTIDLNLSAPTQSGISGSTLSFTATVFAPSTNGATIFLNADSFNVDGPLTLNDDGFFFDFPFSLDAGDSFTGVLFTVNLPTNVAPGSYDGSFQIFGGEDGSAQDLLDTVTFEVNTSSAVPEPGTLLLLATGLAVGMGFVSRGRRLTFLKQV